MNLRLLRKCLFLLACACAFPPRAHAQGDSVESARIQIGPLGLTPSIALTDLGIDSNVFNTFDNPKQDFTFTVSPETDLWLRAGRSLLSVEARADAVYYRQYSSERSLDGDVDARWEIRWNRLTPWVAGGYSSGRQRVGYEIDLRSRRNVENVAFGIDTRIASKTRIGLSAQRTTLEHDADAFFLGSRLREVLNRRTESVGVQYRQALTPLTTFVLHGEAMRDRFAFAPARDSDSTRLQAGFDLEPFALVAGRARIGYRKFDSVGGGLPDYSGVVASFAVSSVLMGRTKIDLIGERDINYSYQLEYPYYVLMGAILQATPRLSMHWDLQGRVGLQRLAYRAELAAAPDVLRDRTDRRVLVGAGVGYRLGRDMRLGINVDRQRRQSPLRTREYESYHVGASVTYGR